MIDWLLAKLVYGLLEGLKKWLLKQLELIRKALWKSKRQQQVKSAKVKLKAKSKKKRLEGAKQLEDVYNNRDSKPDSGK